MTSSLNPLGDFSNISSATLNSANNLNNQKSCSLHIERYFRLFPDFIKNYNDKSQVEATAAGSVISEGGVQIVKAKAITKINTSFTPLSRDEIIEWLGRLYQENCRDCILDLFKAGQCFKGDVLTALFYFSCSEKFIFSHFCSIEESFLCT